MFKNPFSLKGRIRRTEYAISLIITFIYRVLFEIEKSKLALKGEEFRLYTLLILLGIPIVIAFFIAQAVKRCHDIGKSGWWILVPLFALLIIFWEGDRGPNQYGEDPKKTI